MNAKTKELIAIGASVAGHCQPCLTYHVGQANKLGLTKKAIGEAIAVGRMVEKGAMLAMDRFAGNVTGVRAKKATACCAGEAKGCGS